jgi:hypothetical protein
LEHFSTVGICFFAGAKPESASGNAMTISKKDIPYGLLKAVEPLVQANWDIIQLKQDDNTYYSFVEKDPKSKNFFRVFIDGSKRIGNYDKKGFAIEFKPLGATSTNSAVSQGDIELVITRLQEWIKILRDYDDTISVHDDNFTKRYAEFYYEEFKTKDEDANIAPFNPEQQDIIDLYLDAFSEVVKNSEEKLEEGAREQLLLEIAEIKQTLSTTTKSQVIKRVTKIFGKIYKSSKSLGKDVVTEAKKYLLKKLFDAGVEYGPKIIELISEQ